MTTTKYRKIKNGKVFIHSLAFGLLEVKKQYDLPTGLQNVAAYRRDSTKKNLLQRYICYVIYDFNPNDGTYGYHETFRGKNATRDAIRCLERYNKIINKFN